MLFVLVQGGRNFDFWFEYFTPLTLSSLVPMFSALTLDQAEDVFKDLLDRYSLIPCATSETRPDSELREPSNSHIETRGSKKFKNVVVIVDPPRSGLHPTVSADFSQGTTI